MKKYKKKLIILFLKIILKTIYEYIENCLYSIFTAYLYYKISKDMLRYHIEICQNDKVYE